MCGVVGFRGRDDNKLDTLLNSIAHRGPDDRGVYSDDNFSLGHVRLSILDLSSAGHQPMVYEDLVLIFNGEIYNFKEIRDELSEYEFHSDTDSEVVLKAFHKWGVEAVDRFRGMFAFAIYDKSKQKIFVFRDRAGVKPLYYYYDGNEFAFASETRALKKYNEKLQIEKKALCEYLQYGYISSSLSIYQSVKKLQPGHYLHYDIKNNRLQLKEYWSILPYFNIPKFRMSEDELIDKLEEILIESFRYRMVADVPVGVFLSGGIDSSIVAAILQKHYGSIHTFTIGFKEARYNEADWAKKVAEHLGTNHTEKYLSANEAKEILEHFVDIYDEPFGDSSGIPTSLVSKVAKDAGVKVVLSADGGDEVFCGYSRYWMNYDIGKKIRVIPYPLRRLISYSMDIFGVDSASKLIKMRNFAHKYNQFSQMLKESEWQYIYENMLHSEKESHLKALLGTCNIKNSNKNFNTGVKEHPMQGMMLWDYHRYLPDDILVKVDRATMYHSIEGREPLLDHKIAEFMAQVPFEYKYRDGSSKYLLRKVLERYIPKELIERPKMGFGIPMFEWFGTELIELFDKYFKKDDDIINMEFVRQEYKRFRENRAVNVNLLWFVLVYLKWKERYM